MSVLSRLFGWICSLFWKEEMELTMVGLQNSGKTSFVRIITSGKFIEDMMPTVGFNFRRITKGNVIMWDLGGQARFRSMWGRYCRGVDVIVFMVDASDDEAITKSHYELHSLLHQRHLEGIPVLVLGNKRDISGALDERELIERLFQDRDLSCYSISCKEKENIDNALQWVIEHRMKKR